VSTWKLTLIGCSGAAFPQTSTSESGLTDTCTTPSLHEESTTDDPLTASEQPSTANESLLGAKLSDTEKEMVIALEEMAIGLSDHSKLGPSPSNTKVATTSLVGPASPVPIE
jgi:hypothetical protein